MPHIWTIAALAFARFFDFRVRGPRPPAVYLCILIYSSDLHFPDITARCIRSASGIISSMRSARVDLGKFRVRSVDNSSKIIKIINFRENHRNFRNFCVVYLRGTNFSRATRFLVDLLAHGGAVGFFISGFVATALIWPPFSGGRHMTRPEA